MPPFPLWYAARALRDPNDGLSPLARSYQAAAPWLSAVWQFIGSALFGVAVGYGLDAWRGWGPWGLVVGGLVGSAVGFYAFIHSALKLMDAQSKQKKKEGP